MATDEHTPKWRNVMFWSAAGAVTFIVIDTVATLAGAHRDGMGGIRIALYGILVAGCFGFAFRNLPISWRKLLRVWILLAVAIAIFASARWGFRALGIGTMGVSETVAAVLGLIALVLALMSGFAVAAAYRRPRLLSAETTEDLRARGRLLIYDSISMAALGLLLILLSIAGPGGALSPKVALAGALVLFGIAIVMPFAAWPLMDELAHALHRETSRMAFNLISVVGGGWAMLAHLGYVAAPAPLDWVSMFILFLLAASFISAGRRGLLKSR